MCQHCVEDEERSEEHGSTSRPDCAMEEGYDGGRQDREGGDQQ